MYASKQRFLVYGLARSGLAAVALLRAQGKDVVGVDEKSAEAMAEPLRTLKALGVPAYCGTDLDRRLLDDREVLILSPGVPRNRPLVDEAVRRGILVGAELDLGAAFARASLIGVTGTNGKTTTVHLIRKLLQDHGFSALLAGNVGEALCDVVMRPEARRSTSLLVVEISSFQLETIHLFRPRIAVVLNLSPDHLDRYAGMEDYFEAKRRITQNQTHEDLLVVNQDDPGCREIARKTAAAVARFSLLRPVTQGAFVKDGEIVLTDEASVVSLEELPLVGLHNVENVLAACVVARRMGLTPPEIADSLRGFRPVEHRLERVGQSRGVMFYNDSKATNLASMAKALLDFSAPVVLIAGGQDKKSPYEEFETLVGQRVKTLVLVGQAAPLIERAWGHVVNTHRVGNMEEAVARAYGCATAGDVVLLSPACASFDMYANFEERGRDFKRWVNRLIEMEASDASA